MVFKNISKQTYQGSFEILLRLISMSQDWEDIYCCVVIKCEEIHAEELILAVYNGDDQ